MIKANFKSIAICLAILTFTLIVLSAVDGSVQVSMAENTSCIRVCVVDLGDQPVHNATVQICGQSFYTDNKGMSPTITITETNSYDSTITSWHTVNVGVKKDGYVSAAAFNCVVLHGQTRKLVVKLYPTDSSDLPFVSYVESPPESFLQQFLNQK